MTIPSATIPRPLWTASDIAAATDGTAKGTFSCGGVSIDSRTVARGDLFIALRGPSHDGHDWVDTALQSGAAGAIVDHRSKRWRDVPFAGRLIFVDDTFQALHALGRAARARFTGTVIGVTGSVGKTSSKDMLALALSALGQTHAARASLNNHWGVPLTLARTPQEAAFAVIEMGMNHAGEIQALTAMARPHVALITAIAGAHMEHLGSLEAIAHAKAEIFDGVAAGGTAILPLEAPHADLLRKAARDHGLAVLSFGRDKAADVRLLSAVVGSRETTVSALIGGRTKVYSVGAVGEHWAMNSVAVLGTVKTVSPLPDAIDRACRAVAPMHPPRGRGRHHQVVLPQAIRPLTVIDETYNANPTSVRAALAAMAAMPHDDAGRRIVVIGDMLELGPNSATEHAALVDAITQANIDLVFTAGPLCEHLYKALPVRLRGGHAHTAADLAPQVRQTVTCGDVVMAKGSKGSRMGCIVDALLDLHDARPSGDSSSLDATKE